MGKRIKKILISSNVVVFILIGFLYFHIQQTQQVPVSVLAPHIQLGPIVLKVSNLEAMKNFYTVVGLSVTDSDATSITLGSDNHNVITLVNSPTLPMASLSDPGLDQIALVYTSQSGLANVMKRMMTTYPGMVLGATNRVVSQSLYVADPQGNTLELYYDTDPTTWVRRYGKVQMDELPMDANQFVAQYAATKGDQGLTVGHLQLRIGDIAKARQFYVDTMGFYISGQAVGGGSLSLSDGFYHHNLGLNQIQGYDGDTIEKYLGIQGYTITLPNAGYVEKLKQRLTQGNIHYTEQHNSLQFTDPWGIAITINAATTHWWNLFLPSAFSQQ